MEKAKCEAAAQRRPAQSGRNTALFPRNAGKRAGTAVPASGRAGLCPAAIQEKAAFQTTGYDVLRPGHFSFETLRVLPISKAKSAGQDGRTRAAAKRRYAGRPASRRKGRTAAVWAGSRSERRKDSAGKERRKRAYLLRRTTRLREDRQERRQRWIGWTGAGPVLSDGMTTPFAAAWRRRPAYALYLPSCQAGISSVCRIEATWRRLPFRRRAGRVTASCPR